VETTLAIVKPDTLAEGHAGDCISAYEQAGLRVSAAVVEHLSRDRAALFYAEHTAKPFFSNLLDYMTSAPVLVLAIAGPGAIAAVREINGATDPADAAPGTLRARFGKTVTTNSVHASATADDAVREVAFFFPSL